MNEDCYTVKTVCRLTGLNEHTLRAWERRYGAVKPARHDRNARRLYSAEDVERLRTLAQLVQAGLPIGQIAARPLKELRLLFAEQERLQSDGAPPPAPAEVVSPVVGKLLVALHRYDLETLDHELGAARARFGAKDFALGVVLPLMSEVGRLVMAEQLSIGQEHALSAVVKAHLLDIFFSLKRVRTRRGGRSFVLASMEGDLHELGLLVAGIVAAGSGEKVTYLGPNMPPDALARVTAALKGDVVLLGFSRLPPGVLPRTPFAYLKRLTRELPRDCAVWLGGAVPVDAPAAALPREALVLRTMGALEKALA